MEVVSFMDGLGIAEGPQVLKTLGFNPLGGDVDLKSMTNVLEEEVLQSFGEAANVPSSLRFGILACLNEVRFLQTSLANVSHERDKLRLDLGESNQRALVLAQEIDDQNAKLEKQSRERAR